MKSTREAALLDTTGLIWRDEETVAVGEVPSGSTGVVEEDLRPVEQGGRETTKMVSPAASDATLIIRADWSAQQNMYTAIRDAMAWGLSCRRNRGAAY